MLARAALAWLPGCREHASHLRRRALRHCRRRRVGAATCGAGRPMSRCAEGVDLATQQELANTVADPCEVDAQVLTTADQIAQMLLVWLRDAHHSELASAEQTGQADSVTLVNLDVVGGVLEDVPGRADNDIETSLASSPDQSIARRPCLVHGSEWRGQRGQPLEYCFSWSAADSLCVNLSSRRVQHRGQRLLGVNIYSHPPHTFHDRRLLIHRCGHRPRVPPSTDSSPRQTMREAPVFVSPQACRRPIWSVRQAPDHCRPCQDRTAHLLEDA